MSTKCSHEKTNERGTYCFTGDVSVWGKTDSNPAAHGNIVVHVECAHCGARRRENINGLHCEVSPWLGSRAEREQAISAARLALAQLQRPAKITLYRGNETADVWVDSAGYLVIEAVDGESVARALPAGFLAAAQAYRRAVRLLEAAIQESK